MQGIVVFVVLEGRDRVQDVVPREDNFFQESDVTKEFNFVTSK
jgi:hypothetical protein